MKRSSKSVVLVALFSLGPWACSTDSDLGDNRAEEVVTLSIDTATGPLHRLGGVEAVSEYELYESPMTPVFLNDSTIAYCDNADGRIAVLQIDGTGRWFAGGPGEGPGEARGVQVLSASDGFLSGASPYGHYNLWSEDGELLESRFRPSRPADDGSPPAMRYPVGSNPDGMVLFVAKEMPLMSPDAGPEIEAEQWVELHSEAGPIVVLSGFPPVRYEVTSDGTRSYGSSLPHQPALEAHMRSDRTVTWLSPQPTVTVWDLNGQPLWSIEPRGDIHSAIFDSLGRLWISDPETTVRHVYSAQGELEFRIDLGRHTFRDATSGTVLLGKHVDGVTELHVYELPGARTGES